MKKILQEFMNKEVIRLIKAGKIDNEYGLQFELGYYLRVNGYDVSFEKNIKNKDTCKHEIDLLCDKDNSKYAIELKYPRGGNKGYTDEIFRFIQDIQFCEELKNLGYKQTYCITLVDDKAYYELTGREKIDIWKCFRGIVNQTGISGNISLCKQINRQVKNTPKPVTYRLERKYQISWSKLGSVNGKEYWYYILEI